MAKNKSSDIRNRGITFSFNHEVLNPLVMNGLSHPYSLVESTFTFRVIWNNFSFYFSMNFLQANRIAPDGTPRFAASHLGLFCLPMYSVCLCPIKRTPDLIGLKQHFTFS